MNRIIPNQNHSLNPRNLDHANLKSRLLNPKADLSVLPAVERQRFRGWRKVR